MPDLGGKVGGRKKNRPWKLGDLVYLKFLKQENSRPGVLSPVKYILRSKVREAPTQLRKCIAGRPSQ